MTSSKLSVQEQIMKESIFIVGVVSGVEGRKVRVRVNKDKNLSHLSYKGQLIKNVSVGGFVKITKGFVEIVGKVQGEFTTKVSVFNEDYGKEEQRIARYLEVSLFGHFEKDIFKQGIKEMPLIDNECYILDKLEFQKLHRFFKDGDSTIPIGILSEEPTHYVHLGVSKLFASHIGIFGNTGSGKSNTLARIYTELFELNSGNNLFKSRSKFIIIDFNGEYTRQNLISAEKSVYNLSTRDTQGDKYFIRRENIERLEVLSVLLEATEKTQKPFLNRVIRNTFLDDDSSFTERSRINIRKIVADILQKADPKLTTLLSELFTHLSQIEDSGNAEKILKRLESGILRFNSVHNTFFSGSIYANDDLSGLVDSIFGEISDIQIESQNLGKIKFKILSQFYHEIINGYSIPEHIRPLIGRMFKKFDTLEKLISIVPPQEAGINTLQIINLKEVNLEMKKTLPLIIAKQLYDDHKSSSNFDKESLHIIIDEAHNILSSSSDRESDTWKDYRLETFEELIKEGRKFSTFLTISSQRPHDISPTIISQLHNYFIHRLINENDIRAIEKTIAYLDRLSFETIPILSVGSCFVAGLASDIPIKVDINLLPTAQQPRSETINLDASWST